jgi:transcriptional regulator with XRE-family HTH domain
LAAGTPSPLARFFSVSSGPAVALEARGVSSQHRLKGYPAIAPRPRGKERAMSQENRITGRQIAAARALTGVSRADLAARAGVSLDTLRRMEASGSAFPAGDTREAVRHALEDFGAVFIPEGEGLGGGVRLKFTRLDAKQIGRLEGEGGPARDDDVP